LIMERPRTGVRYRASDLGAPGGIRTPNLLIRRVMHVRYWGLHQPLQSQEYPLQSPPAASPISISRHEPRHGDCTGWDGRDARWLRSRCGAWSVPRYRHASPAQRSRPPGRHTHPVADPAGKPRHCRTVHTDNAAGRPTVRRAAALTGALMLVTVVGCWSPDRPRRAAPARRVSSGRGRSRRLVDQPSPQRAVRCCPADVSSAVVWACRAGRSGVRATLVIGNQVIAATENDTVYALSSREWVGGVVGVVGSADARFGPAVRGYRPARDTGTAGYDPDRVGVSWSPNR
jgi:hypothetical protein